MRLPTKNVDNRPIDLNQFKMDIPQGGYCWVDEPTFPTEEPKEDGPYMVMKELFNSADVKIPTRVYYPLSAEPNLFLRVRDLELDVVDILEFANRYGSIADTCIVQNKAGRRLGAVAFGTWRSEIQHMILAHHLFSCIQSNDRRTLRKYFKWHPTNFDVFMGISLRGRSACSLDPGLGPQSLSVSEWLIDGEHVEALQAIGWNRGDVLGPARLKLMKIINPRLSSYCHPRLFLNGRGDFVGHMSPVNLLGCIWLQFYTMLTGQLKFRICTVCGAEMDVTESRSTRKMHDRCSKRMRQQRWRAKTRAPQTESK